MPCLALVLLQHIPSESTACLLKPSSLPLEMPQLSLRRWFPSLQGVSLPHGPAFPFAPCSFATCPWASAPPLTAPRAAWQDAGMRDECLLAPAARNNLKLSNMSLSMDSCSCSWVLGYLGMARRSRSTQGFSG